MTMQTFKDAYAVLSQHAQTLREQQEPNMDELLTIVTESVDAYKVCLERIKAVEQVLNKAGGETGAVFKAAPHSAIPTSPTYHESFDAFDAEEKVIPFFRLLVQPQFKAAINHLN